MASQLMQVCMSTQDMYGARYIGAVQRLDNVQDKTSQYAAELRGLVSLYATILVAAISHMPETERDVIAKTYGGRIDGMVKRRDHWVDAEAVPQTPERV